jgi:hypothetical protein
VVWRGRWSDDRGGRLDEDAAFASARPGDGPVAYARDSSSSIGTDIRRRLVPVPEAWRVLRGGRGEASVWRRVACLRAAHTERSCRRSSATGHAHWMQWRQQHWNRQQAPLSSCSDAMRSVERGAAGDGAVRVACGAWRVARDVPPMMMLPHTHTRSAPPG